MGRIRLCRKITAKDARIGAVKLMSSNHSAHGHHGHDHAATAAPKLIDPVCGMNVKADTPHRLTHEGQEVLFCSAGCKAKFEADPAKYAKPAEASCCSAGSHHGHMSHGAAPVDPSTVPAGAKWTCPMHPEIVRDGPGSCPICGMALEPMMPSADSGPNPELLDMSRRFWIGALLALPVLALEMGRHLFNVDSFVPPVWNGWIQFLLATPVVLWGGWPFFERGWASLQTRNLNMFTLIALGTGVAWSYSVVALFAPAAFPPAFRDAIMGSLRSISKPPPSSPFWCC
jgi:Cu+-exporting ATPase